MNHDNWTIVFKKLSEHSALIKKCYLKLAGMDQLTEITIPSTEKYADVFGDHWIKDVILGGPVKFEEIEWLEFPASWTVERMMREQVLEPLKFQQDIFRIKEIVPAIKPNTIECNQEKLRIYHSL